MDQNIKLHNKASFEPQQAGHIKFKLTADIYRDIVFNKPPFKGFINHQNCCYINSPVQILVNCNLFQKEYQPQNQITKYLHYLQNRYEKDESPIDIKQFRDIVNKNQKIYYQHNVIYDAMEFLVSIIANIDKNIRDKFIAVDIVGMEMESIIVPITQLAGKLYVDEYLKNILLTVYPSFLIVEISRGKQDGFKLHQAVYYNEAFWWRQHHYRLKAVLNHRGFEKDGHFNVKIRSKEDYYLIDEMTVVERELETRSRTVAALIYEKIQ